MYELGPTVNFSKIEAWNENPQYHIESTGNDISVILIGERHSGHLFPYRQEELISLIKPGYVLYEPLAGMSYFPNSGLKEQPKRQYNQEIDGYFYLPGVLKNLADQLGFEIRGCNPTSIEAMEMYSNKFSNEQQEALKKRYESLSNELKADWVNRLMTDELMSERDQFMANMIVECAFSYRPAIAIVGALHAQGIIERGLLKNKGFDYCIIDCTKRKQVVG